MIATKYEIHPAALVMPEMPEREYQELKADIEKHGLLNQILLADGKIIDGRHRYRAIQELGMELTPDDCWDVDLEDMTPGEYVWSLNGHRRHLTPTQRGACFYELVGQHAEEEAKKRQVSGLKKGNSPVVAPVPEREKSRSRDEVAQAADVSPRTISDVKKVKESSPELFNQMKSGKLTAKQAAKQVRDQEKRSELKKKANAAKKEIAAESTPWKMWHGDCLELLPKVHSAFNADARLIFADPPYNIGVDYGDGEASDKLSHSDFLEWTGHWLSSCAECLTSDGSLWVMINDEWAEYVAVALNRIGLTRRAWIKWYETFGVNCSSNFNRTSRHIFYYVKNPKKFVFNADAVNRPSDRQTKYGDKRAADGGKIWDDVWQIPRLTGTSAERVPDYPTQIPLELVSAIVGCASDPGDVVVDPFAGSGTTGAACKALNRKFVGIELREQWHEQATLRIAGS